MRANNELTQLGLPLLRSADLNPQATGIKYLQQGQYVVRKVEVGGEHPGWVSSRVKRSTVKPTMPVGDSAASIHEASWLRSTRIPPAVSPEKARGGVRIVDLFAGCGGLSLGAWEACRALRVVPEHALIADTDPWAREAFARFFGEPEFSKGDVLTVVDGELGAPPTPLEKKWRRKLGAVDLLLAGPPCQGHSNLNNHTRRDDVRNLLYLRAARFVEVFRPKIALIENVSTVVHDRAGVVSTTKRHLESLSRWRRRGESFRGYSVEHFTLRGTEFGMPQARKRHFLLASARRVPDLGHLLRVHGAEARPMLWAIEDLIDAEGELIDGRSPLFGVAPTPSQQNRNRIRYLFEKQIYDLPDSQRPPCHRDGGHSYVSVYGRLRPDLPSPTITTGFGSAGQGRFIHPLKERTITPHEAARLQYFPDFFKFDAPDMHRKALHKLIGNAVPPRFAFMLTLELLRGLDD